MAKIKITELRNEKNITQQKMAKMLGISNVSLHYYETGQRKIPKRVAKKMAEILEVKFNDIFLAENFSIR